MEIEIIESHSISTLWLTVSIKSQDKQFRIGSWSLQKKTWSNVTFLSHRNAGCGCAKNVFVSCTTKLLWEILIDDVDGFALAMLLDDFRMTSSISVNEISMLQWTSDRKFHRTELAAIRNHDEDNHRWSTMSRLSFFLRTTPHRFVTFQQMSNLIRCFSGFGTSISTLF